MCELRYLPNFQKLNFHICKWETYINYATQFWESNEVIYV